MSDDTNIEGATIQITGNYQNGQDVLAFADTANITGSWDAGSGTLTLSGSDTLANYQAALRAVTYQNTSDDPSTLARTVSFTVDDGDDPSNTVTRNINLTAENDASCPGGHRRQRPGLHRERCGHGHHLDADRQRCRRHQHRRRHASRSPATTRTAQDVLAFADTANITGSWDAGTGTLTLTGTRHAGQLPGGAARGDLSEHLERSRARWPARSASPSTTATTRATRSPATSTSPPSTMPRCSRPSKAARWPTPRTMRPPPSPRRSRSATSTTPTSTGATIQITGNYARRRRTCWPSPTPPTSPAAGTPAPAR